MVQHLVRGIAVDTRDGVIQIGPMTICIHTPHQIVGSFHQVAVTGFGFQQHLFSCLALRYIGDHQGEVGLAFHLHFAGTQGKGDQCAGTVQPLQFHFLGIGRQGQFIQGQTRQQPGK